MEPYRVFLHVDLLETVPRTGRQRELIMDFVRLLAVAPLTTGDFSQGDDSQRELQVKIVGNHAVSYWVDEPVRSVMIVGVRLADL